MTLRRYIGWALGLIGFAILVVAWIGVELPVPAVMLLLSLVFISFGAIVFGFGYLSAPPGIKNNGIYHSSSTSRGMVGWVIGVILTAFYVALYWFPEWLGLGSAGEKSTGLVAFFDSLSQVLKEQNASEWFVYGTIYTVLIVAFGVKFMLKYRHNRYQLIRTMAVMASQLFLAYLIPAILEGLNSEQAYFSRDIKYFWPLNYYFFEDWHLNAMTGSGTLGMAYLVWGILGLLVVTPLLTYLAGKRWYCSWVCGCGGLAETCGDSFRHLSSKKLNAWKLERWLIYGVMVFIFVVTAVVLYGYFKGTDDFLGLSIYTHFRQPYGFLIGAAFSGVIGVGFYPLMGNRVWCRFGCPLAGYMGIFQRFKSRFRITSNGGQCISCGNCSTYCEMGIDVRWYAQRGQNIVRSSCVGCGICAAVCPRGVLKLEDGPLTGRINDNPIIIGNNGILAVSKAAVKEEATMS